jgi:transposase
LIWADGGYAGKLVTWAASTLRRTVQIVRRPDDLHTFKVLPRRWVVERTFGWIMKHRRCVRDYERLPDHHETYLYWSMIQVMTARLARRQAPAPPAQAHAFGRPAATLARTWLQAA